MFSDPASARHDNLDPDWVAARLVARCAQRALLAELLLTPKPGLVDQRNAGAHRDMDLRMFLDSARAVSIWFPRFVEIGMSRRPAAPVHHLLPRLRTTGLLCEREMFEATGGVNTHKGAIFSLGLLCAAAGSLLGDGRPLAWDAMCAEVADICVGLVDRELGGGSASDTAGERMFRQHGLTGARGEAASGYATVRLAALPAYHRLRLDGASEKLALLQALLHLFSVNGDTNLVARGGLAGLDYVRRYAGEMLQSGGVLAAGGLDAMAAFDDDLIARHLSPSGSADLLAVTWFLAQFPATETSPPVQRRVAAPAFIARPPREACSASAFVLPPLRDADHERPLLAGEKARTGSKLRYRGREFGRAQPATTDGGQERDENANPEQHRSDRLRT